MSEFIPFTEEEKLRAADVDLEAFLESRGETLERSGREKRLASDHSVTVRGNRWYDHSIEKGGNAISFVRRHYNLSFVDAMSLLLGAQIDVYRRATEVEREVKPFELPEKDANARRTFAYLMKTRFIPKEIISHFLHAGNLYQSKETHKDGTTYQNAVFVGLDREGKPQHAIKHGLQSQGKTYKGNVESSNAEYGFAHIGSSDTIHAFEAPIDMLSYIALHPEDWQQHSFICLAGLTSLPLTKALEDYPHLEKVRLCLDYDEAGIDATYRIKEQLGEKGYLDVSRHAPMYKDWNEDLKAKNGIQPKPREQHPSLKILQDNLSQMLDHLKKTPTIKPDIADVAKLARGIVPKLNRRDFEGASEGAFFVSQILAKASHQHYLQMGQMMSPEHFCNSMYTQYEPHKSKGYHCDEAAKDFLRQCEDYIENAKRTDIISQEQTLQLATKAAELALLGQAVGISILRTEERLAKRQVQQPTSANMTSPLPS